MTGSVPGMAIRYEIHPTAPRTRGPVQMATGLKAVIEAINTGDE